MQSIAPACARNAYKPTHFLHGLRGLRPLRAARQSVAQRAQTPEAGQQAVELALDRAPNFGEQLRLERIPERDDRKFLAPLAFGEQREIVWIVSAQTRRGVPVGRRRDRYPLCARDRTQHARSAGKAVSPIKQ